MTTTTCARLLSQAHELDGAFNDVYIRGEIRDGRLIARVNHKGPNRKRARIRVHPEDLVAYVDAHHAAIAGRFRELLVRRPTAAA